MSASNSGIVAKMTERIFVPRVDQPIMPAILTTSNLIDSSLFLPISET